jgi:hypothetical protein
MVRRTAVALLGLLLVSFAAGVAGSAPEAANRTGHRSFVDRCTSFARSSPPAWRRTSSSSVTRQNVFALEVQLFKIYCAPRRAAS